jgi:hypothetical protein
VPIADLSALAGFSNIPIILLKVITTSRESLLMAQDRYHIRVKGHLSPQWSDWFDGFTITNNEDGEALLSGIILDQAALYGLLNKISNLGLPLLSVNRVESENASHGTSDVDS